MLNFIFQSTKMKKFKYLMRALAFSVIMTLVIDTIINFEDYKQGWHLGIKKQANNETMADNSTQLSNRLGKVAAIVYSSLVTVFLK